MLKTVILTLNFSVISEKNRIARYKLQILFMHVLCKHFSHETEYMNIHIDSSSLDAWNFH